MQPGVANDTEDFFGLAPFPGCMSCWPGQEDTSSLSMEFHQQRSSSMTENAARLHASPKEVMDKYEKFEAWLRDNGAQFDALELREYDDALGSKGASSQIDLSASEEKKDGVFAEELPNQLRSLDESEMRGVHARVYIPPNTVCMSVPRKCLITVEMGQATPLGQAILNSNLDLDAPKHIFLMIYLLWDRKVNSKKSFFHPYYEILPQTLRNMPIFWSQDELLQLEGSYLLAQIADRNDAIAEDYHAIIQVCPELEELCTLDEFKWARMCVCSRNFGLQMDGHRTSALVPHADMLNHYRPRETKWTFDEEKQAFTITTLQGIPVGAQVYDSYGQKCNHRFLLNYGFAVEHNRELDGFCPNEVPLELGVSVDDPVYAKKAEFWTRGETHSLAAAVAALASRQQPSAAVTQAMEACIAGRNRSLSNDSNSSSPIKRVRVCVSNNENTRLLFSLLRALACNEEELDALMSPSDGIAVSRAMLDVNAASNTSSLSRINAAHIASLPVPLSTSSSHGTHAPPIASFYRSCRDIRHPVSLRNERAAMHLLVELCHSALHQYPTTLAQDLNDLLDEDAFPRFSNKRHAKIQVRGEKEVLHHFLHWAQTSLHILNIIEDELVNGPQQDRGYDSIIREIEEDEQLGRGSLHHTILRYCSDVLGSLRREELKRNAQARKLTQSSFENQ